MTDPNCVHCGARLLEYRGAWFGPGDETTCPAGDRHAPTPVVDDRASIVAFLTADGDRLEVAARTMPEGLLACGRTFLDPATGDIVEVSLRRFVAGTREHREEAERRGFPLPE